MLSRRSFFRGGRGYAGVLGRRGLNSEADGTRVRDADAFVGDMKRLMGRDDGVLDGEPGPRFG